MTFMELAKNRFSERHFDPRPVEQEKLDLILEAGRIAPTAHNYQPQRFYVLRSDEAREKVKTVTRFHYNAPLFLLVCYDNDTVWRAPYDRMSENYNSGEQDASIAATNMMYAAEELGVHNVWVRGFDAKAVKETFNLPDNMIPVMMFAMGYPSEKSHPSALHFDRMPMERFVREL